MSAIKKGQNVQIEDVKTGQILEGIVIAKDADRMTISTPGGTKIINLLEVVVVIIPYIDIIINWVKSLFSRKHK